jgi:phosphoribosylaminoimidazole-succinocarboxamide synthase
MGSVKDLKVITPATDKGMGSGIFEFSNRYSVFDWGEMPDYIENKGASLCMMSAYFFEKLNEKHIPNHYRGLVAGEGTAGVNFISEPSDKMKIATVRVIKPRFVLLSDGISSIYTYDEIRNSYGNFIIPIEVIYRNSLPKGSSVFRRLREGTLTLKELGLSETPSEGHRFSQPFIDGSTKYEEFDRYPGWHELLNITEMSGREFDDLKKYANIGNEIISEGMKEAGFVNEDGKFEFAFGPDRKLMFVDTMGTLDECRFTYNGVDVSKEIPRQWYRYSHPEWVAQIESAKKANKKEWKGLVELKPNPLPSQLKEILENIYPAVANAVIGRQLFSAPPVGEIVNEYEMFKATEMKQ